MEDFIPILNQWPAFSGRLSTENVVPLSGIEFERGTIGKVDNASTDYRDITASPNFIRTIDRFWEYLGPYDIQDDFVAWSYHEDVLRALHVYPSRAKDKSNRSGFVEKYILEYGHPQLVNTEAFYLLFILLMLNRVAVVKDEIWWDHRHDEEWEHDPKYALPLETDKTPFSDTELALVAKTLCEAISKIQEYFVDKNSLIRFYQQIDESRSFVSLQTLSNQAIPASIMVALLLPLHNKVYFDKSFTTFIPSTRANTQKMEETWFIAPNVQKSIELPDEPSVFAVNCANALWDNKPEIITDYYTKEISTKYEQTSSELDVNDLYEERKKGLFDTRLYLEVSTRPAKKSHNLVKYLYRFIQSNDQHFSGSGTLSVTNLDQFDVKLLNRWIKEIENKYPKNKKSADDIKLKIDYILATVAFLMQRENVSMKQYITHLRTNKVPLLLLFYYEHLATDKSLQTKDNNTVTCLSEEDIEAFIKQSSGVIVRKTKKKMLTYIEDCL